jgi:hypothetical protein
MLLRSVLVYVLNTLLARYRGKSLSSSLGENFHLSSSQRA